jgi:hypothetical protein
MTNIECIKLSAYYGSFLVSFPTLCYLTYLLLKIT